ncbi:CHAP-domain-containing protein [Linderina pennispora]|uniref:CHAP-domain-containing protein n=1 Tax=Linderina pennispora TaxID=61395 RepID=A0A1Y1WNA7_9FUNG|nr:CHAP-domain-containing protein [Linderina pennispora]ORX74855.1 CHAP-domain-containing protein [Linderina pennispora]
MKLSAIATLSVSALLSSSQLVSGYAINGDSVNCRSGPGTSNSVVRTYSRGDDVTLSCQTEGETIRGDSLWGKTQDGCYVADYYVQTGTSNYVVDKCDASGGDPGTPGPSGNTNPGSAGPMADDYPYNGNCDIVDKWRYYSCQCVSFVAWRINSRLGIDFHNRYKGNAWGNANQWDDAARASGVTVNDTPAPGAVGQTDRGSTYGHVVWVSSVSGDMVTIEEYNYKRHKYGTRTVHKSAFNYIHLKN